MFDGVRVLVVDDDSGVRSLLATLFAAEHATVEVARNGVEALSHVRASERFDLIVLDLTMPVMDGPSFYRELRAIPCDTPVLIVSAYGARRAQSELGAQGSMGKPFDPTLLVDEARRLVAPKPIQQ